MAGFLQKFVSGLDFWNKDENKRQRDQFAREDEEERKRRALEKVRSTPSVAPNQNNQPQAPLFDPSKPLLKVGSQSQFGTNPNDPLGLTGVPKPKTTLEIMKEAPQKTPAQIASEKKTAEIDKIAADNYDSAKKQAEQGEGWFGRNFLNKKAIEERAKTSARSKAALQYKEQNNWNDDDGTVSKYIDATRRMQDTESDRLKRDMENLDDFGRKMTKAGEIASYIPVTGSVMNLGLAGTEKLAKATGNEAYGKDIEDQRIAIDLGMDPDEFRKLDTETQQKLRNLQSLGLALSPLDFIGVGGLAKSGVVGAGKKATMELVKDGAVDIATKQALKKALISEGKSAVVPFVAGTTASMGGQAYVGGTENVDPFEAAKTGLLTAGVSKILPFESKNAAKGNLGIDDIPQQADEVPIPTNIKGGGEFGTLQKAEAGVEEGLEDVNAAKPDVQETGPREVTTAEGKPAIEVEPGIKSTNIPKAVADTVPDVTNPIALAKANNTAGTAGDVPIADFTQSIDGSQPLRKAGNAVDETIDEIAARAPTEQVDDVTPITTGQPEVDAMGNPVLKSDAQVARDLAEQGIVPDRGNSPVAGTEAELQAAAEQAARQETSNPASLRERTAFAATEEDPVLAQEILDTIPGKTPLNVDESLSVARNNARSQSPEQLVAAWSGERVIDQNDPQAWVNALEERKVLNAMVSENVPGARQARLNLADAMSSFQSRSGQNLNILKVAYDEMPSDMKTELLIKKINRARTKAGLDDMSDADTQILLTQVEVADQASARVKAIDNELADFNRAITTGSATPEARTRLDGLMKAREEALVDLYQKNAGVTDYFAKASPDATFGQKLLNWNRVSMLSSLTGRVFDMVSTAGTTGLDTVNRALSAMFARGLNGRVGDGGALESLPQVLPGASDLKSAWQTTKNSANGVNEVRDVMAEINGMNTGRSELQQQSSGRFRNLVKAGTEAPTVLTKYIEDNQITRMGRQAAEELGLRGDDAELYADSYAAVAKTDEKYRAQQEHLKSSMLHNNAVSSKIDAVSNTLMQSNSNIGKTTGAILKSIVAPFTRFVGGMTHRTFTDMNVIHNAWEIRKGFKNGDTQMVSNALAKMTTNMGVGIATATVLAESGVLTPTDANGDSYAGLYFHIGDRYIPVGFAGLASVPIIVGYGMNQAANSDNPTDAFTDVTTDTLSRVLASTGTAGFFGADNALQTAIGGASSAISPSESGANERDFADVLGSIVRQGIPAIGNDINAGMNQIPGLNPTGEAAETKVLNEDGTQNPIATQTAKTQNAIPGLSQMLPRKEGTPARDILDRITKGNRETGEMAESRVQKEDLKQTKQDLEKEGVPVTAEKISDLAKTGEYDKALRGAEYRLRELEADEKATENSKNEARKDIENYKFGQSYGYMPTSDEAVQTRAEKGDYEGAIEGWKLRLKRDEDDGNTPDSKLQTQRRKIQRYEVFKDNDIEPGMVNAYEKDSAELGGVGVTAWRDMMDSGNPELVAYAEKLYNLDKALVDAGAVREAKYYWGKGGRGGGSGSNTRFITDIATQNGKAFNFAPIKAQSASFGEPKSAIPKLKKVPVNDTSKLKKVSVKRGLR